MKKLLMAILALVMLTGCTNGRVETTIMAPVKEQYCLYDQDGRELNDNLFKSYKEYSFGYIVTNEEDQVSLISLDGDEIIPFGEYKTLSVVSEMIYATKDVEETKNTKAKGNDGFIYDNLYILNSEGEVLYTAGEVGIKKSGLPIILSNDTFSVLRKDGEVVETSVNPVLYAHQYNNCDQVIVNYEKASSFYDYSLGGEKPLNVKYEGEGNYKILAVGPSIEYGVILYDSSLKNLVYINRENAQYTSVKANITSAYYDESKNIILKNKNSIYLYQPGLAPISLNTYYLNTNNYLKRNKEVYGPHLIYKDGSVLGNLENCQLFPAPKAITTQIFPVYVKDEGYKFYNFENKNVIATVYDDAEPFDINYRAIVKTVNGEGYSLIDDTGKVITSAKYSNIVYLGSVYYAIFDEASMFGVIDKDGNEIVPVEFTDLPDQVIISYLGRNYLMLSKHGRSYVYSLGEEKQVIFTHEGQIKFNEKGYFIIDDVHYFNFDGEKIN